MADPHALTMSRNGTRSGRESVCLPRRIRAWAVPACPLAVSRTATRNVHAPPNRVRSRSGGLSGLTHRGQQGATATGRPRVTDYMQSRASRRVDQAADHWHDRDQLGMRVRGANHRPASLSTSARRKPPGCRSHGTRVPVKEQISSITLSRLPLLARGPAKVLAVRTKPRRVLRSARQRGRPGARWGVDRGRSGHRFPRSR
jgi:hypothetical protein